MVSLLVFNFLGNFLVMVIMSVIAFCSKCRRKESVKVVSTRSVGGYFFNLETTEEKIRFKHFKRFSRFHLSERPLYAEKSKRH